MRLIAKRSVALLERQRLLKKDSESRLKEMFSYEEIFHISRGNSFIFNASTGNSFIFNTSTGNSFIFNYFNDILMEVYIIFIILQGNLIVILIILNIFILLTVNSLLFIHLSVIFD